MKRTIPKRFSRAAALGCLAAGLLLCPLPPRAPAQTPPIINGPPPSSPGSPPGADNASSAGGKDTGPWIPATPLSSGTATNQPGGTNATDQIQLSFQGANIDMVVQWLSQTTGKSVLKHPQVQCQLTITSSKKVSQREAVNLVYRALALEGFSAIEFSDSILIVPQDKEPRMSPELLGESQTNVPPGRQRLVKVFELKHLKAADVRDRIATALSDKANVFVDEQANQLIITDYNDNIRSVGQLIAALDTDKPEDVTVRVIQLKNVSATDLMKEIGPLYEKKNGKALKDTVEVTADEQSNTLLILSSEANFRVIQDIVSSLDTEEAQEKVMRTFTLKNADAQDVAKQLQDLNQQQNVTARYIFNYSSNDKGSKKMTVVADRRRNAVIVQAPPSQMDSIQTMIAELDAPVSDDSLAPRIYPMKYASASDIEDVLNELFLKKQPQRSYWDFFSDEDTSTPDRDVGRLYGKVRITSEPNSNALIVTANSKENLEAVEQVINQLDRPPEAAESTLHIGLRFAKAADVANGINILFAKNGSPPLRPVAQQNQQNNGAAQQQPQQQSPQESATQAGFDLGTETKVEGYYPWLGGQPDNPRSSDTHAVQPVSDLIGRVRAVADERSNALLISANVHFFPQVLKLIDALDAPTDQVLIDARLIEVSCDYLDALGVQWSPDGSQVFTADDYDNSILASANAQYQRGLGQNTAVNSPSASTVAQSLATLRSGVLGGTLSMDFLVQFLRRTTDATVLAEPQINIRDNETGKLFVGQEVPVPNNTQISSVGSQNTTIAYKDVGVVLEVTPHINSSGNVELKIHAESSTVVSGQTVLGGDVFNTINFRSDLTATNGQTLIVGGIIQKNISNTLRKTPLLGSVPGMKWAFNKQDKTTDNVELMVFLRPRIIRSTEDAKAALAEVDAQAPQVKKWQSEALPPANNDKTSRKRDAGQ
ncbi:MAG TPA: secretin N-terminal domain-containing protein [Candidatus Acidoferrales bacterium]|nr:secretin N-terminal domain-containing protein [Candidatus Acidoferrales bacterium]